MCHEATGRALSVALGTGKGTVDLVDWEKADCLEASAIDPGAIDWRFIERNTAGFESYQTLLKNTSWEEIEVQSGVGRAQIQALGEVYHKSRSAIISWCLGVTQQDHAVDTIREIINVLLIARKYRARRRWTVPDSRSLERAG
jgi:anaerobic selenocysteine-containing dehydrogenase